MHSVTKIAQVPIVSIGTVTKLESEFSSLINTSANIGMHTSECLYPPLRNGSQPTAANY